MSTDDRMETITDRAKVRDSDEASERGDFPCCATPAPVGAAVALDLDAIEAAALADDGWWSVPAFALVAEVRRLAALCIPLTDLAQELDLSRQNLHHSRAISSAHFERAEREKARAESAEAEVVTLRAKVAEGRRIVGMLAETVESECEDDPDMCHEHDRTDDGRCPLLVDLSRAYAALATTGEAQR